MEELSPIEHVGNSFIPALFVHGVEDDAQLNDAAVVFLFFLTGLEFLELPMFEVSI